MYLSVGENPSDYKGLNIYLKNTHANTVLYADVTDKLPI